MRSKCIGGEAKIIMWIVLRCVLLFAAVFGAPNVGWAQVILEGCTGFPQGGNSQPSYLVDLNTVTGATSNPRNIGIAVMCGISTQPSTGTLYGLSSWASSPVSSLMTIDPATGAPTIIGPTGLP